MLVSCVHPVAILRAVFCTICSLSMFVSDALVDHMVEAYSSTGLVMDLYVASMVSLCLPHLVEVRTLRSIHHHHHRVIKLVFSIFPHISLLYR